MFPEGTFRIPKIRNLAKWLNLIMSSFLNLLRKVSLKEAGIVLNNEKCFVKH